MTEKPVLGQPITFTSVLKRDTSDYPRKTWRAVPQTGQGVIVGLRSLQNGYTQNDIEEGRSWVLKTITPAFLVAVHLRKSPIYVPLGEETP